MKTMCNRRMSVRSGVVLVSVCVVGLLGGHAQAVDYIFDPLGAGSADWWVNGNWTPAGFPNSVNDLAIFDASANPSYSTNTHPSSPYTVREMRFDTTSNWRIHNNERDINLDAPSGNALITQNGSGTVTYDSDWILIDNTTLGGTGSGEVILNGSILSSPTQRRGIFGAGSLTKEGSFTATINAIIQHTGGTTINDGVFRLNQGVGFPGPGSTGQFGSAHTVTVNNGGTLQLTNHWVMGDGVQNQVVVNEGGTLQFLNSDHYLGNIELTGGAITTSGGTHPWRTGNFGPGLITVNPSATTSTIAGTLCFVGTGAGPTTTFDVAGGGQVVMSSHIYDHGGFGGAMRLVKEGAGKLTLTSATSSWDGGLSINGGTVSVPTLTGGNTAGPLGGWSGTSAHFSFDGGTLEYTGGTVGGINRAFTINAGGATIDIANAAATVTWTDAAGAGPIIGTGMLTKAGPGTLVLASSNAYTGGTLVDDGTLRLGHVSSLGTGAATVNSGATLDLAGANVANDITLNGGTLYTANGASGTITLNNVAGNTINANGNYRLLSGQITGPGGFTFGGINTPGLSLSNPANDFQGDITVNAGAYLRLNADEVIPDTASLTLNGQLRLEGNGRTETIAGLNGSNRIFAVNGGVGATLRVGAGGAAGAHSGQIGGGGANNKNITLVKIGAGTQTLSGNSDYTGGTTVSQGMLLFQNANALGTGTITLGDANSGSADISLLAYGAHSMARPILVSANGTGTKMIGRSPTGGGGYSQYTGAITLNDDLTINSGNNSDRMHVSGGISGTGDLTFTGGRRITLAGSNTFDGDVFITGTNTILQNMGGEYIPNTSSVDVGPGAILQIYGNETIDALTGSGTVRHIAGSYNLSVGAAGGSGVFTGVIQGNVSLTKTGSGTQTLTGNNSYDGGLAINGGTVSVPQLTAGNTNGPLGGWFGTSAYFSFDGGTLEYTGPTVGGINRAFTINAGGATIDIANAATTVTWTDAAGAGPIIGPGMLTKAGPGTLVLASSNAYTGGTLVDDGTLRLGNVNSLGTGAATVNSGATLDLAGANVANDITINGGTLYTANGASGTITLNNVAGNTINANGNYRILSGQITGPGGFTMGGINTPGIQLTNPANDFQGDVTINGGSYLRLTVSEVIPDTANVTINGYLRLEGPNRTETIAGMNGGGHIFAIGSGNTLRVGANDASGSFSGYVGAWWDPNVRDIHLVKIGNGTQTLSNTLYHTGDTTVDGGTLTLNKGGVAFPSAGASGQFNSAHTVTVNSGATLQVAADWVTGGGLTNQIVVNGGTLQFLNSDNYMGNIELTGGAITTSGGIRPWRTGNWGSGLITVNASAASSTIDGSLCFVGTGSAPNTTFNVADGAAADDLVVSALIYDHPGFEGQMTLVKDGPGKMVLSGNSSYSGATNVDAGTLLVNGTHTGGGIYTVAAGATLGGTGDIESDVDLSGAVAPGASVGTFYTNSQTWHDGGSFLFEINDVDALPGTGWDLLDVTGSLDLTGLSVGGFSVDVVALTGATPGPAADFDVLGTYAWEFVRTSGGVDEFDARDFVVDSSGFQNGLANISRFYVFEDADSLFLGYTVPEPSTFILAALGLLGLAFYGRRRKR